MEENFEAILEKHHPIIYKICRVYAPASDFDDLYQEVAINIWKSHKNFIGKSKLSTWIYRVALNTALTFKRNTRKKHSPVNIEDANQSVVAEKYDRDIDRQIENLYAAISKLKKDDRALILLYLEQKSYEEIADIVGITVNNVGVKINRVKKRLFKLLKKS